MTFMNDYALVGFWPMVDEPSGSPYWYNRAPRTVNGGISGISFDMRVARFGATDADGARAAWPGRDTATILESGTSHTALRLRGAHEHDSINSFADKYLVAGDGGFASRRFGIPPDVTQSGWTCGMWVLPQSDGWYNYIETNGLASATEQTDRVAARIHGLASRMGTSDRGFTMGVSGQMNAAQQFPGHTRDGGPHELRAFVHSFGGDPGPAHGTNTIHLDTPIVSGVATHITVVFRAENASTDTYSIALYTNGHLAASGQYTEITDLDKLCIPATVPSQGTFGDTPFVIGATQDETTLTTDSYNRSTGWNHLVSGVYWFERPLWDPEIERLHGAGGIQPSEAPPALGAGLEKEVLITDPKLITYINFQSPGFIDASRVHLPLLGVEDESCKSTNIVNCPGPFDRGGACGVSTNQTFAFGTLSGTLELIDQYRSFTISMFAACPGSILYPHNLAVTRGATGDAESDTFQDSFGCFQMGYGVPGNINRGRVRIYSRGAQDDTVSLLEKAGGDHWVRVNQHFAFVYDAQTNGVAFYMDGYLQESGTLTHNFADHMARMSGSGYPIYFAGGVQGDSAVTNSPIDFVSNGGLDLSFHEITIFGRPLEQQEIKFLAASGIDTDVLAGTLHDPRLRGFWAGTETNKHIIPDRATAFQDLHLPLVASESNLTWQQSIYGGGVSDNVSPFFPTDWFSRTRSIPPELASFGNLGMTSGAWSVMGGSQGGQASTAVTVIDRKTSYGSWSQRFKPSFDERDQSSQHFHEEWIVSYEVTPSGNIPKIWDPWTETNDPSVNCILHAFHEGLQDGHASWLTSLYANNPDPLGQDAGTGPSGITLVLGGTDGGSTVVNHAISGNIPYGIPSRVLIHLRATEPYVFQTGTPRQTLASLYIGGEMVARNFLSTSAALLWSDQTPNGSSDDWVFDIGGISVDDVNTGGVTTREAGLGNIFMRNVFVMRGKFTQEEVDDLAANGIDIAPSIQGYTNDQGRETTTVSTAHTDLEAYYRFAGGQSGAVDLSLKNQPPIHLARVVVEDGNGQFGSFSSTDNTAFKTRYVPGPLSTNDLNVQCSGITFRGSSPALDANSVAPFVVSGVLAMTRPDLGFSICFLYAPRDPNGSTEVRIPISYGGTPAVFNQTLNRDCSWAIVFDPLENIVMHVSVDDGRMHFDPGATTAELDGSIRCGFYGTKNIEHDEMLNQYKKGAVASCHLDAWTHYAFVYDPAGSGTLKGFMNGTLVNRVDMGGRRVRIPTDPAGRMINFLMPFETPWTWKTATGDEDGVLTDFAYFSAPITDEEVRYIAYNGISSPFSTEASGIIGGFSYGQDTGSGIIGSYVRAQDTGSGIFGGFELGSIQMSGIIGGFSSGVIVTTGLIGGYLRGMETGSGIIGGMVFAAELGSGLFGGYLRGWDEGSGLFGGHVFAAYSASGSFGGHVFASVQATAEIGGITIGGLFAGEDFDAFYVVKGLAAQDFDAQMETTTRLASDFDAAATVFQSEAVPLVAIIIPGQTVTGLVPPFDQYFIGKASGTQDKTIAKTIWSFGDLTTNVQVPESGAGCYPVSHRFATSGFFVVRFTAIDSDGVHNSATRFVNIASGIPEALISLSGVPQIGEAALSVAFYTKTEALPPGVSIVSKLLSFDDGQTTTSLDPVHNYTEPGIYRPIWCIRDSRGFIWCDSLEPGIDFYKG